MDAPSIQYARAQDGGSVAWWSFGDGPPVLCLHHLQWSHPELEWAVPQIRRCLEALATRMRLIRMCQRGCGLTRADVTHLDSETLAADITAVLDAAGCDRVAVLSIAAAAPLAGALAAHGPERIAALILAPAVLDRSKDRAVMGSLSESFAGRGNAAFASIMDRSRVDPIEPLAKLLDEAALPEAEAAWGDLYGDPLRAQLQRVRAPALLLHWSAHPFAAPPAEMAALIPHLRIVMREGRTTQWYDGDLESLTRVIGDFVDEQLAPLTTTPAVNGPGFRTVLFTDIEASTELTRRLGDDQAQEILRGHNAAVRSALGEHSGTEVKHTGDGIMASFPSAVSAVRAALQIQRDLATAEVRVRIGLNAGEPIAEDDDLFGLSVIKAARIADRAEPGQVLVSDVVRQLAEGKRFSFTSIGPVSLKGFDEPVALYTVETE